MQKFLLDARQGHVLLDNFEKVRADLAGDEVVFVPYDGCEVVHLITYMERVEGRSNVTIQKDDYRIILGDEVDNVVLTAVCVHDCGICFSNRYVIEFEEGSKLAERVLSGIPQPNPCDRKIYGLYAASASLQVYEPKMAESSV